MFKVRLSVWGGAVRPLIDDNKRIRARIEAPQTRGCDAEEVERRVGAAEKLQFRPEKLCRTKR
jgi:alkyl hydroperoxide reductase subunit AhpC